ncbi:hypothetical protein [Antrihabitans cavernicola]|uniref:Uncharacterized protein n=1 Tax=Antrihabitans cavernicola TaxID=2495913 RepID=A0A5A7S7S7_9NOCA|nr:hypothetical protein [Spelaeibacter cavernicola]KAA0018943.1 hypothetical protein FOY51_23180 [Spelaeibacter cavernicola]
MRVLVGVSVVTVICAVAQWVYVVSQLLANGVVEVGGAMFETLVVFSVLVGVVAALLGAVVGAVVLIRQSDRGLPGTLMAVGQILTVVSAIAIVFWALNFGSTGWELLLLPAALMFGQIPVAVGLFTLRRHRRGALAN